MFEWTDAHRRELRERYPVEGPNPLAEKWGISKSAVVGAAFRQGLKTKRGNGRWPVRPSTGPTALVPDRKPAPQPLDRPITLPPVAVLAQPELPAEPRPRPEMTHAAPGVPSIPIHEPEKVVPKQRRPSRRFRQKAQDFLRWREEYGGLYV